MNIDKRTLAPDLLAGLVWDNIDDQEINAPGPPGLQEVTRHILGPVNLNPGLISILRIGGQRLLEPLQIECLWEQSYPLVLEKWLLGMSLIYLECELMGEGNLSCAAYIASLDGARAVFQLSGKWVIR